MDKTFRIATKDNQEKILAVLGGEDSAGAGGLVDQIKKALESMGPSEGMVRYQQPTNLLEFYALPKGRGIATAWRDPVDQLFFDRYGLADSAWEKTVVVANQDHFPENVDDGVKMTNTQRNLYQVADGDDVTRGNWYFWDLDPTKKTYFRFFTYGTGGVCNSNLKNSYTYDPDVRGAIIFGASKERLMELFGMSTGFGQAVRLGLGLKDEIVEGVNVSEMDDVATYAAFLARKDLLNAATSKGSALERSAYLTKDFDTIMAFYNSAPKWIDAPTLKKAVEDADIKSVGGVRIGTAIAASDVAMRGILKNANAMSFMFGNQTAKQAVLSSNVAMKAVAASAMAMKVLVASDTLIREVAESDVAMKALLDTKDVWTKHATLNKTRKTFANSTTNTIELAASGGLMVAISTYNSSTNIREQTLYSGENRRIQATNYISSEGSSSWNFIACGQLFVSTKHPVRYFSLTYDHYTAKP